MAVGIGMRTSATAPRCRGQAADFDVQKSVVTAIRAMLLRIGWMHPYLRVGLRMWFAEDPNRRRELCLTRKLYDAQRRTSVKAKQRVRKPASLSEKKLNTFARASTALAQPSKSSRLDYPRRAAPASSSLLQRTRPGRHKSKLRARLAKAAALGKEKRRPSALARL